MSFSVLLLLSCSTNSNQRNDKTKASNTAEINENKLPDDNVFTKVYSLKKKDNSAIGDVYVKFINDSIFTDLCVVNEKDTLYTIKRNFLTNTKGKDIEVFNDGFYGYLFVLKKNDYFVLSYLRNNGSNISDDISIEWNYQDNILEVQKVP